MRPEIKEYHYDWLMWGVLHAAANLAKATPKEYSHSLRYIPYFRGIANAFISSGETGAEILRFLSKYYENILSARGQGKKMAITSIMVKETRKRAEEGVSGLKSGKEKMRALICYIDHYTLNTRFWDWLDERGIAHIGIMSKSFRDTQMNSHEFGDAVYGIDTSSPEAMLKGCYDSREHASQSCC